MDNNQSATTLSTGTNQGEDQYNTPLPQGATLGPSSDYSTPIPEGATVGGQTNAPQPTSTKVGPLAFDTGPGSMLDTTKNLAEGVAKQAGHTFIDASKIGNPGQLIFGHGQTQNLENSLTPNNTAQKIGAGGETIGEFLLGDAAATKGLALADKLGLTAKALKILDNFPKVKQALELGINVGKAGTELGPEERELLSKYPVLARLVGVGMDAIRQGTVQATQTGLQTGNAKEALESGGKMAGASAVLGVPLATVGGLLEKGGEAANTAQQLHEAATTSPTESEAATQLGTKVNEAGQPIIDSAEAAKARAEGRLATGQSLIENAAVGAPSKSAIVTKAQTAAKQGEQAVRDAYTNASEAIRNDPALDGLTIPGTGSAFQDKAAESAFGATKGDDIQKTLGAGVPASPKVMDMVMKLAEPKGLLDVDEAGNPRELDINNLLDYAKNVKEQLRKIGYSDPQQMRDRQVYYNLLDGIHESIADLVEKSGKPELEQAVQKMNSDYRNGIQTFNNPDVKAIINGSNENGIINTITGGKSVGDIKAIKNAIGDDAFGELSDDAMRRIAADSLDPQTGQFSMKRWVGTMSAIPNDVRAEMFKTGKQSQALENILQEVRNINGSGTIENSDKLIQDTQKTMQSILGNSNVSSLLKDPQRIVEVGNFIGPDAMAQLGTTILKNQIRNAATKITKAGVPEVSSVDTGKIIDMVKSLKDSPEALNMLFRPTPETAEAYNKLMSKISHVQNVKNLINGGLVTASLSAAATAGGAIFHSVWAGIAGAMVAAGGDYAARRFLEDLANSPKVWATLRSINDAAQGNASKGIGYLARVAAGKVASNPNSNLKNVYQGTQTQLSNQ